MKRARACAWWGVHTCVFVRIRVHIFPIPSLDSAAVASRSIKNHFGALAAEMDGIISAVSDLDQHEENFS